MATAVSGRWTRVRTLGRGASGAEVFLAADQASGDLFAVKCAPAAAGAELLRRERALMAGLRSPHVVPCIGGRAGRDGSYQLFLEYAPGGSLADVAAARSGGRLEERAVAAYAADVAAGLAYVHAAGLVHGDVKPRNVVVGADGRAKLADFGCARRAADDDAALPIGGTPAFMAPEVARAEAQGPPADVWALGCTVLAMATGRAPWAAAAGDVLAAVRLVGYTDAVPEVPQWLSAEAKDFLGRCLKRRPGDRSTAAQLLEHPFIASKSTLDLDAAKGTWVSPKSTLDAAFWESESDSDSDDDHRHHHDVDVDAVSAQSTADRIGALACPASALPDWWDSDEGWIDVLSAPAEASSGATVDGVPCVGDGGAGTEEEERADQAAEPLDTDADGAHNAGEADASPPDREWHLRVSSPCDGEMQCTRLLCDTNNNAMDFLLSTTPNLPCLSVGFMDFKNLCSFLSSHSVSGIGSPSRTFSLAATNSHT
jgi:mitogen-activated protein kinase kinase kinase 17/18